MKRFAVNKGFVMGLAVGGFVAPFLATLGLISHFFEVIRPILIGPMDIISPLIPNIQTAPNTFYVPWYKWIITLGFNSICYGIGGYVIGKLVKRRLENQKH